MQGATIREDHRGQRGFMIGWVMIGWVIVGQRDLLGRRLDDPVRIAVAEKEALEFGRLGIAGGSHQHNTAGRFADDANAAPYSRLRDEIRDIALGAHESLQLVTRYAKKAALSDCS